MMQTFTDLVQGLPAPLVYGAVAALVFAEAALFFGFVFPGETAIIVGGLLASQGRLSLSLLLVIVVLAAIGGDSVGYEIGRRYGPRLLSTRAVRKHRTKVAKAQDLIRRRGAVAVFIGRFTALLRALMPALAGSSRLPYPKFLVFNAIGGLVWGVGFTLGGFFVGEAFERFAHLIGEGLAIVVAVLAVIAIAVWSVRKHRREAAADRKASEEADRDVDRGADPAADRAAAAEREEPAAAPEPSPRTATKTTR
jgi:membrane-associated protein